MTQNDFDPPREITKAVLRVWVDDQDYTSPFEIYIDKGEVEVKERERVLRAVNSMPEGEEREKAIAQLEQVTYTTEDFTQIVLTAARDLAQRPYPVSIDENRLSVYPHPKRVDVEFKVASLLFTPPQAVASPNILAFS